MKATLRLLGSGRAILSTDQPLTEDEAARIRSIWSDWIKSVDGLLIFSEFLEVLVIEWPHANPDD